MMSGPGFSEQREPMPFDLAQMFRRETLRRAENVLTIPTQELIHDQYHQPEVNNVLKQCADLIVKSCKVWRWNRFDGTRKLVRWHDNKFISDDIDGWWAWLGQQQWRIMDTAGMEWLGPSRPVMARILEAILDHSDLPLASFQLQDEMQRKARK
jgi:hypothetical protein